MGEHTFKKTFLGIDKKVFLILIALFIGIILIVVGADSSKEETGDVTTEPSNNELLYSETIENKIKDFLSNVSGIDSVSVFVTIDGSTEYKYAQKEGEGYTGDYLIVKNDDGEEAAVVREIYPSIRGVAIACTGGNDPSVKEEVVRLLSAGLGISAGKIEVIGND